MFGFHGVTIQSLWNIEEKSHETDFTYGNAINRYCF
jgi:hypothetical protein